MHSILLLILIGSTLVQYEGFQYHLKGLVKFSGVIELKNVTLTLIHGQLLYQHMYNLSLEFVNKLHKVLVIHEKKRVNEN